MQISICTVPEHTANESTALVKMTLILIYTIETLIIAFVKMSAVR